MSVRTKLLAVIAVCLVPAVFAALMRAQGAGEDLVEQVKSRIDYADDSFDAELVEDLAAMRVALRLATAEAHMTSTADSQAARTALKALSKLYPDGLAIVIDADGKVVAAVPDERVETRLPTSTGLAPIWQGQPVNALLKLEHRGWCMVSALPIFTESQVVGALALALPFDTRYLDTFKQQVRADFALRVNDELVAATSQHPDPALQSKLDGVVTMAGHRERIAIQSFRPTPLQGRGMHVVVTAAEDVRDLQKSIMRRMQHSLMILGAALLVALGLALLIGGRIANAVKRIAAAANALRDGAYPRVDGVHTGDELEHLATSFNEMVAGLEERDHIRDTFGKYVSQQVAEKILKGKIDLAGELMPVTIVFSDIRDFTSMSENMDPKALVELLNDYFTGMVESVLRNHGVVDKFIGDGMMAVFGAPTPDANDPLRAVRAALEMRERLVELNRRLRAEGRKELRIGIGIHTGMVIAGNIGHADRKEYTVIGDSVNLTSRLESLTKELSTDIIMSADTYELVKDDIEAEALRSIRVRGREQEVMVYRVISAVEPPPQLSVS